jgi:hypothetical protein
MRSAIFDFLGRSVSCVVEMKSPRKARVRSVRLGSNGCCRDVLCFYLKCEILGFVGGRAVSSRDVVGRAETISEGERITTAGGESQSEVLDGIVLDRNIKIENMFLQFSISVEWVQAQFAGRLSVT